MLPWSNVCSCHQRVAGGAPPTANGVGCHLGCVSHRPVVAPTTSEDPTELLGRCFNCLSSTHQVAICRLPWRCLCCRGLHHLARNCMRPRHVVAPQRVSRSSACMGGPMQVTVAGVEGSCRHRQRHRGKQARVTTSCGNGNATTTIEAGSFPVTSWGWSCSEARRHLCGST